MITREDLDSAIARCLGEPNPTAQMCIKLAAYYTIRAEMYGENEISYSNAAPAEKYTILDSGSEFARVVAGKPTADVYRVMDELLDVLQSTHARLYNAVMRKLEDI